VTVFIFL